MVPSSEQYAQLAALFTTSDDSPASRTSIELLLPAHLPVQGGLWLVPYAGREAANGLSILVRMHEETVDVAAIGIGSVDITACSSIEDVISQVDMHDVNWIVQPPSDADPTSLLHCDADFVTLLSGADQAAVVGAYRLLKGLIAATGENQPLPPLRLIIVGAEERSSSDAASRIVQTAHHQLGVQIEVGQPLPAMSSSSKVVSQVSFSRSSNVVDFMSRIRNSVGQESAPIENELPLTSRCTSAQEQEVVASQPIEDEQIPVHTVATEIESTNTLASHIDGLLAITPRCPEHEHVELAVDGEGCLHLLANSEDFRDLTIVKGWVIRHSSILSLACGGLEINHSTPPVQHLFTDNAVSVADLHGSGVRLHLLTDVEVGGNTGLFSTPLN
jgi:hypothetical protein